MNQGEGYYKRQNTYQSKRSGAEVISYLMVYLIYLLHQPIKTENVDKNLVFGSKSFIVGLKFKR